MFSKLILFVWSWTFLVTTASVFLYDQNAVFNSVFDKMNFKELLFKQLLNAPLSSNSISDKNLLAYSPLSTSDNTNYGYVYSQVYTSDDCSGQIVGSVGISTEACVPYNESSYSFSFNEGKPLVLIFRFLLVFSLFVDDCSDLMLNTFSDLSCQQLSTSVNIYENISQCMVDIDADIGGSAQVMCSTGKSIPVNTDSILFR
jgi:hypothetical protein